MRTFFTIGFAILMATTVLSGCLGDEKTTAYHAHGTKGSFAAGFAYEGGAKVTPFLGNVFIDVNDAANTGMVVAKGKVLGADYEIHFDHFQPSKPFHDGGIAANFREHGASGVGDKSIPEVMLDMAGWGHATLKVNGQVIKDTTGKDSWVAHFMVIENGVRDNATGAIYADANKTKAYSDKDARNGTSVPGDWEIHLVLRNNTAENATGAPTKFGPINGPATPSAQLNMNHNAFTNGVIGSHVRMFFNVTGTGVTGSNVTFTVKSPSGGTILTRSVGPATAQQGSPPMATVSFEALEIGQYTVSTSGRVAPGGGYNINGVVAPPPANVLNFWWEDILFGEDAEAKADAEGLHNHGNMTLAG